MDSKQYFPLLGTLKDDGNLSIPTAGMTGTERWDGRETIEPLHPSYAEWLRIINDRGPLGAYIKATRKKRLEERRAEIKAASRK